MVIQKGIRLGVPGFSYITISTIGSGQSIQEFVKRELEPIVADKSVPIEELLKNSGILIKVNRSVLVIGNLVTTAGGTYLRHESERDCFVLPDGVRYSGKFDYSNLYSVQLSGDRVKELAGILNNEGLENVQIPSNIPNELIPRIKAAKLQLDHFVRQYYS